MTLESERPRRRFRLNPYLTTGLALSALIAAVLLLDSHSLLRSARGQLWGLNSLHYAEFDRKLPARGAMHWYVGVGPGALQPEQGAPVLQPLGGVYQQPVRVQVEAADPKSVVHCTFDGRIPTNRDARYAGPVTLDAATVVRCRAFRAGFQASDTTTATYVVNTPGALPILALTIDPTNLANKYTGIYARFAERGSQWERDAHVEYLPRDAATALRIAGRIRMHGYYSRTNNKKSFRFYFPTMGPAAHDADNPFTWSSPQSERVLVFGARELSVSRDELFQKIYADAGGFAPTNKPVLLYLNARPWGLYFVRERVDMDFLQRRRGPGEYDLLDAQPGKPRVLAGDRKHWEQTQEFFAASDLTDPQTFARAAELIDVDNFTKYWLYNIYAANFDWPHHNMNMFRSRDGADGRWRWISWDADATFDFLGKGLRHDTLAWATRSELRHDLRFNNEAGLRDNDGMLASTLIARKLFTNPTYRQRFVAQMADLLATDLKPERVMRDLDALHGALTADLQQDWLRWSIDAPPEKLAANYERDLALVRTFIMERPRVLSRLFLASDATRAFCGECGADRHMDASAGSGAAIAAH